MTLLLPVLSCMLSPGHLPDAVWLKVMYQHVKANPLEFWLQLYTLHTLALT